MSDIICLREYIEEPEAQIAKCYLNDNGIEADVFRPILSVVGIIAIQGFRLMINEDDKETAEDLLRQVKG